MAEFFGTVTAICFTIGAGLLLIELIAVRFDLDDF
jgi:hypothetical protein